MRQRRTVCSAFGWATLTAAAMMPLTALAQGGGTPAQTLLAPYGGVEAFPRMYRRALNVFINAENAYFRGDAAGAAAAIDALFAEMPPGAEAWAAIAAEGQAAIQASGLNIGSPPCYYALRMLRDCCEWKLHGTPPQNPATITWTILLVGQLEGRQPRNANQRAAGRGPQVQLTIDPQLTANEDEVIRQSTRLFREYVMAMTDGRLTVALRVQDLPQLVVPGHVTPLPEPIAGLTDEGYAKIWAAVPPQQKATTDWWWILYPSIVPGQSPAFRTTEFITGGMGRGPDGKSPCFIVDDQWLVRKPPHMGHGPMHDLERRAYLPQWLQHEFFHHLFGRYPEFQLEVKGHDWFDRSTWPADFVGRFEPDYYYEALHKRLQQAEPPLHVGLRYAVPDLSQVVTPEMLVGRYRRPPVENDWHVGELKLERGEAPRQYRWTNREGVSWLLTEDLARGVLVSDPGSPYIDQPEGKEFKIQFRPAAGETPAAVEGFRFNGELYRRGGRRG